MTQAKLALIIQNTILSIITNNYIYTEVSKETYIGTLKNTLGGHLKVYYRSFLISTEVTHHTGQYANAGKVYHTLIEN